MDFTIARKEGNGAIIWSDDQTRYIISEYTINDKTLKELSQKFNVLPQSIRNLLRKNNIEITNKKIKDYPRNLNYFKEINSKDLAYWLGYFYSDGSIASNNNTIELISKDLEQVEKFRQAIGAINNKISTVIDKRFTNECIYYNFSIRDKIIHNNLINLGCVPNKSYINFHYPNIPQEFDKDFIRGYFDGDGSIYFTNNKYKISFVGNKTFLEDLKIKLNKENISLLLNVISKITYELKICGQKDVKRILDMMYQYSTENIRLNRKYELYIKYLNYLLALHT